MKSTPEIGKVLLIVAAVALTLVGSTPSARATLMMQGDNPHGPLDLACNSCHSTEGWDRLLPVLRFNHDAETRFPLEGQHKQVACAVCHTSLVFRDAGTDCFSCHVDIHEGQFGASCEECHSPRAWLDESRFRQIHQETRFPLLGVHASLDCQACHSTGHYRDLSTECITCHLDTYQETTTPDHSAAGFSTDCRECHSLATAGAGADRWTGPGVQFEHTPSFPLIQGHGNADCAMCHEPGIPYAATPTDCYSCHQADFESTGDPDHSGPAFDTNCEVCHTIQGWSPAQFLNHDATGFPLDGAHTLVDCNSCHTSGYTGTPDHCYGCHRVDYESVPDPDHTAAGFDQDCTECHTTLAWQPAWFDHIGTDFIMDGAHVALTCIDCHSAGYNNTSPQCFACHEQDYVGVQDPIHTPVSFDEQCTLCHTTSAWSPSSFNHDQQTSYTLTGTHQTLECSLCHIAGNYVGTPDDCWSCHETQYRETDDPDHEAQQFPFDCTLCHSTITWEDASFDHDQTNFPLTGAHRQLDCVLCHSAGYTGTPTDCYACHQADYEGTDDPDHVEEGFPFDCSICHNTSDWEDASFDHDQTRFPLTGAHRQLDCVLCHSAGYTGTPTDCYACHQADYEGTDDPDHVEEGFPFDCSVCHNTSDWEDASFDHDQTQFPLTGAHRQLDCVLCHSAAYTGTPTDCYSCHQADYEGTDDPDHSALGYSHDCTVCHTTDDWDVDDFDHATYTDWPLTGAHLGLDCNLCHATVYSGTPTDCWSCHEDDYNSVADPNHSSAGFGQNCTECHTTADWTAPLFDHGDTGWPLTGSHVGLDCALCHSQGYTNTPADCFFCHETEYNSATNPNHLSAGFPLTCESCHNTVTWDDATFNHDQQWFPIYSGEHRNEWDSCSDCHPNPNNFLVFTCISCHEHRREEMDDEHEDVNGYVYESSACYECHPDGEADRRLMKRLRTDSPTER